MLVLSSEVLRGFNIFSHDKMDRIFMFNCLEFWIINCCIIRPQMIVLVAKEIEGNCKNYACIDFCILYPDKI